MKTSGFFDGKDIRIRLQNYSDFYETKSPRLIYVKNSRNSSIIHHTQMQDSYFAYCPSGRAPWSVRSWHAILYLSIPIIFVDNIIEPFERFLNYSAFSVKVNTTEAYIEPNSNPEWFLNKINNLCTMHENSKNENSYIMSKKKITQ